MSLVPWLKTLWKEWDLQMFVMISLFLQTVLIFSGNLRKRMSSKWLSAILWLAYLLADSVATLALGILVNNDKKSESSLSPPPISSSSSSSSNQITPSQNDDLLAFWAPFLLLHLGGPDTITAFSLEDNELYLRHALNLLFQVVLAFYVFFGILPTRILAPTLLMFLAGIVKYGERSWALMSASMDRLRNSMLTDPDAGPNYAKFMEEYASKKAAGLPAEIIIEKEPEAAERTLDTEVVEMDEKELLKNAYDFIQIFKRLVVELILSFHERNESQAFFLKRKAEQAFKLVETELAFLYEILYTKSVVIHTKTGCVLRLITCSSVLVSLVLFIFTKKDDVYKESDIIITYILLVGALFLELYAAALLIFSDWSYLQLQDTKLDPIRGMIYAINTYFRPHNKPRWSNSMSQYNLVSYCQRDLKPSTFARILEHINFKDWWDHFWYMERVIVTDELKKFIFEEIKSKSEAAENSKLYRSFGAYRGEWALQRRGYLKELGWSIEVEFDKSILLWHIATDICYYTEVETEQNREAREISKRISDYMLYLLIVQPFMLTAGIGQIRYGDTCEEAKNFFLSGPARQDKKAACKMILEVDTKVSPIQVKGDRSQSVLFDGCILAKSLEAKLGQRKWQMVSTVWVEILSYAAGHCRGLYHAKQLSVGGELLTLVWLLTAHLGIGEQFRIEAGHARAKLIVGK